MGGAIEPQLIDLLSQRSPETQDFGCPRMMVAGSSRRSGAVEPKIPTRARLKRLRFANIEPIGPYVPDSEVQGLIQLLASAEHPKFRAGPYSQLGARPKGYSVPRDISPGIKPRSCFEPLLAGGNMGGISAKDKSP